MLIKFSWGELVEQTVKKEEVKYDDQFVWDWSLRLLASDHSHTGTEIHEHDMIFRPEDMLLI